MNPVSAIFQAKKINYRLLVFLIELWWLAGEIRLSTISSQWQAASVFATCHTKSCIAGFWYSCIIRYCNYFQHFSFVELTSCAWFDCTRFIAAGCKTQIGRFIMSGQQQSLKDGIEDEICDKCLCEQAELFQATGEYCLKCWQDMTHPSIWACA